MQKRKTINVNDIINATKNIDRFSFIQGKNNQSINLSIKIHYVNSTFSLCFMYFIDSKLPFLNPNRKDEEAQLQKQLEQVLAADDEDEDEGQQINTNADAQMNE